MFFVQRFFCVRLWTLVFCFFLDIDACSAVKHTKIKLKKMDHFFLPVWADENATNITKIMCEIKQLNLLLYHATLFSIIIRRLGCRHTVLIYQCFDFTSHSFFAANQLSGKWDEKLMCRYNLFWSHAVFH